MDQPDVLPELREFASFAAHAADKARKISMSYFRQPLSVNTKSDDSPVTIADRSIETMLRDEIVAAFPAHGIFGEEHGSERIDAEYVWVIDPIDGTRSFITGWPLWGTLISLLHHGEPVLGLIDVPVLGERWMGMRGGVTEMLGAKRVRCATSGCASLAQATVYATSPDIFSQDEAGVFEEVSAKAASRRFGGDCYSYAVLASGFVDAVVEANLQPYDYLAIVPVVEAAGGVVTDWQGRRLGTASGGRVVAAASSALHREIVAVTSKLSTPS